MPIYEYLCRGCGQQFEWLLRSDEKPSCPSCGRAKLTKQLSVPAAHMAGAGEPACPAKEAGSCAMSESCGNRCGMSEWG
ncbi:MAG: zinc ribbon domain-containing protein [Planctomycetota bacterium]